MLPSFRLYRILGAEHIYHIAELEKELDKASENYVELHMIVNPLDKILVNKNYPFDEETNKSIPNKFVSGTKESQTIGSYVIYGFLSISEVKEVVDWIKYTELNTFKGFETIYDNLDDEVKENLYNNNMFN